MKIERDPLKAVIEKFPDLRAGIEKCFREDEDFREICEDYYAGICTTEQILSSGDKNKKKYLPEYQNAIKELELELLAYLKRTDP